MEKLALDINIQLSSPKGSDISVIGKPLVLETKFNCSYKQFLENIRGIISLGVNPRTLKPDNLTPEYALALLLHNGYFAYESDSKTICIGGEYIDCLVLGLPSKTTTTLGFICDDYHDFDEETGKFIQKLVEFEIDNFWLEY